MKFIVSRGGSMPDVADRRLRASDLPQPMTNATADRLTRDTVNARQRALMRVSGFGDDTAVPSSTDSSGAPIADATAAGGTLAASGMFGGNLLSAVGTGVVTIVAATWALRALDGLFRGSR